MRVCDFCKCSGNLRRVTLPIIDSVSEEVAGPAGNIIDCLKINRVVVDRNFDICDKCLEKINAAIREALEECI